MSSYHVNRILEEKKITDFLQEKHIYPLKKSGEKYIYRCPIHSGDNDPSFIVYPVGTKGRNYQTYHCFGCHSGINIINLKSDLDKVSVKEAINFFLKDVDINITELIESTANSTQADMREENEEPENEDKNIELLMLLLNITCREYLTEYGDVEEVKFFDNNFYKKVDKIARSRDIETLDAYYNMLIDNDVLVNRADAIRKRIEDEETSASEWII